MKKMLRIELVRAVFNTKFALAIMVGLVIILIALKMDFLHVPLRYFRLNIYGGREFLYTAWFHSYDFFIIFAPLFAAYPYSDSYILDRLTGHFISVNLRVVKKKYIISKAIANAIIGGLAILIPVLVTYLIVRLLSPACFNPWLPDDWITRSSLVTVLTICFASFLLGATFATFSLVLSTFIHNRYMVMGFPLFLFFAYEILIDQNDWWSFTHLFSIYYWNSTVFINTFDFLLHLVKGFFPILVLLCFSIFKLFFYLRKVKNEFN